MRPPRQALGALGELGFLARLPRLVRAGAGVEVGIGDDCAVVRADGVRWLLTTDALVEDVHFRRGWDAPRGLGRRAFAVNASDVAAMGGAPRFALLSLALPNHAEVDEVEEFIRGFERAARATGASLVGGNLSAAPQWVASVTLVGTACGRPLLRSGARPGDAIYVSGALGGAALVRERLLDGAHLDAKSAAPLLRPNPRLALGRLLSTRRLASAAIDVSDGLLRDLGHVAEASGIRAVVEAQRLPFASMLRRVPSPHRLALAVAGGEDYELVFTVAPASERRLAAAVRALLPRTAVTRIGRVERGRGVEVRDEDGRPIEVGALGFDHFRTRRDR